MNSNSIEIYPSCAKDKNKSDFPGIANLSPITNLSLNLSGLSTANSGTPIRRISWSNPISKETNISIPPQELSCADSPTFQGIFPRRGKIKYKVRKFISNALPSDSDDDKENIVPLNNYSISSQSKKHDESMPCRSQDSGYSGCHYLESPLSPLPTCKISFSSDEEEDGFESIFELKETDGVEHLSPVPPCMSHLLTKPLLRCHDSPLSPSVKRQGKLPIRRCLSMEMDSESDSSSSESTSKRETFIAPLNPQRKSFVNEVQTRNIFKRPEPPINNLMSYNKRRKSSPSIGDKERDNFVFQRSYSETAATIMHALLKADLQPELVGDGSRSYALPLCKGRHEDLKSIAPQTLVELLKGNYKDEIENFILVDCRYPYEFEGGHIKGAKNIFTKEDIVSTFFSTYTCNNQKNAIIFHCEFSSERAPTLCRFLRRKDREMNEGHYPRLHHPEMYLLEGGYKAFFENYRDYCEPQDYKPMNHKDHGFELRHFRAKSKSWGSDCKGRSKLRSNSMHTMI
ncbi:M-phase inducer phosphatase [Parasteatoda tepidariorum]|uniref:M-phase inducer phosphatase n=1 Tax=Parasteatoda tepidariorum TaxID=114398 RepID=UPI00077FE162|nr:M-phase inducer phosphatase [Parasteatoda tepidariorum]